MGLSVILSTRGFRDRGERLLDLLVREAEYSPPALISVVARLKAFVDNVFQPTIVEPPKLYRDAGLLPNDGGWQRFCPEDWGLGIAEVFSLNTSLRLFCATILLSDSRGFNVGVAGGKCSFRVRDLYVDTSLTWR